jgi:palmitoyl-protein thioesterase
MNLKSLTKLVLYKFANESTVEPPDSAWFGFYDSDLNVVPMRDQPMYKEDWIGLRTLDREGRIDLLVTEGGHVRASEVFSFFLYRD